MIPSVSILMARSVDYAGLMPPASLPMSAAVSNYLSYAAGENAWALGRFVVPALRLRELPDGAPLRLSVLLAAEAEAGIANAVDSVEIKASSPQEAEQVLRRIPTDLPRYVEVPVGDLLAGILEVLVRWGARAKVRTGGSTACSDLAHFLAACHAARIPFKASAGLHHALRSAQENRHGFLNVLLAAVFVRGGMSAAESTQLLEEESPAAFSFDEQGVSWRGCRAGNAAIEGARQDFITGFGSCSFEEPIDELKALGLL